MTLLESFELPSVIKEGWGITHFNSDNKLMLVVSDGTDKIFHVDP
jgi:glutamine cyclotransferase